MSAHDDLPIIGYADRLSAPTGTRVRVMVSTSAPEYEVELERLDRAGGIGTVIGSSCAGRYDGRVQALPMGSYVEFPQAVPRPSGWELSAWIWPTAPGAGEQALLGWGAECGLFLDEDGRAMIRVAGAEARVGSPLARRAWARVRGGYDPSTGEMFVEVDEQHWARPVRTARAVAEPPAGAVGAFALAAAIDPAGRVTRHYDGKLDAPLLRDGQGRIVAAWDLAQRTDSSAIVDASGAGHHGRTVNQPMRAVTGHDWDGGTLDFRMAPQQYAAVAFHRDDLSDAGWESDFTVDTAGLRSGVYAVVLRTPEAEDRVPLIVTPAAGAGPARVRVLLPTYTYLAYGNERHWWHHAWVSNGAAAEAGALPDTLGPRDRYAAATGMVSLYDFHTDGTLNSVASRMRPLANVRGDYLHPALSGPFGLSADLHLVQWLEEGGYDWDVITDEELHAQGASALNGASAVITGNHPEYVSAQMLDGIEEYVAGGGRFLYLGGNGFYWVTSVHPEEPHVIEVRRGQAGTRPTQSEPGENNHAFTGEPGGLWRNRGRGPNRLVGVGTAGFVFSEGRPFRRAEGTEGEDVAWIFEGLADPDRIGQGGALMGAAGSFEFDRFDRDLGAPRESVLVASAENLQEVGTGALEELLAIGAIAPVQSDLVLIDYPGAGAVFTAGACGWIPSLLENERDNDASRLTANVLRRFLNP